MYLNKVMLYGNLTRDPELKALPSGQTVASFGIATNRSFKNKEGQTQEQSEFHNLVSFGRQADVIGQYLKKGRAVFVEGRLQTRSWDSDGKKMYRTEIVVEQFQFGPSAGETRNTGSYETPARDVEEPHALADQFADAPVADAIQYPDDEINPEDIPF